ncbi:hypothetical protein BISA_0870 [Bifidobacterium saguini DSM 23967]|uniref:Uncharacterized protein n=2 Tax=Bifidobacterium saguini TaxID=762210 RepID=A0A087DAB8_9BIFI|nr:hypothetical protein [Bifidobacterium saguini]KFI92468.1 hypothetical protein BISA_0870 [Bifidobacterium saguini DSM 23967]QTB90807.1 hypothetical protein BSD967_11070 [Bifidobacterium saguini]QTB90869.1 hypothetical protein BSD967_11405 [Bifidobacterium saguini]
MSDIELVQRLATRLQPKLELLRVTPSVLALESLLMQALEESLTELAEAGGEDVE